MNEETGNMKRNNEVEIKVHIKKTGQKVVVLHAPKNKKLIDLLRENDIKIDSPCSGSGTCGKCRVRFEGSGVRITNADMRHISKEDLSRGYRLACMCMLTSDAEIYIDEFCEDEMEVLGNSLSINQKADKNKKYGIGIDIGTTTLAVCLVELPHEDRIIGVKTGVNHQRSYGTDVISRIKASKEKGARLKEIIQTDLVNLILELLEETQCSISQISSMAIAGNTTMLHLLRGYDCESLGVYPYTPFSIGLESLKVGDVFPFLKKDNINNIPVTILPGFTAFVGADILSGLYAERPWKKKKEFLFLDLGTNGEMAAGCGDKLYVTSTAAGPVFEGNGISFGVPGIPGAISEAYFRDGKLKLSTIGNKPPVGICGTGVLEIVSALIREGIIDNTGLLKKVYFEKGYPICKAEDGSDIVITQNDIRQVQMAKAAVNVGLDMIFEKLKLKTSEDSTYKAADLSERISGAADSKPYVIISGGFGAKLSFDRIKELKMFPEEIIDSGGNVYIAGNTSLKGCAKYLCVEELYGTKIARDTLSIILKNAEEIELSQDDAFSDKYYEAMNF
jgi:uncharacterized 2Fe-2S/4Fe-4S cluster protein (DUF4445 family)